MQKDPLCWFYPTWIGGRVANAIASKVLAGDGLIAMFHEIVPDRDTSVPGQERIDTHLQVQQSHFSRALRYLAERDFAFVSLDDLFEYLAGRRQLHRPFAAITFDDGYKNVFTQAFPVLRSMEVPFTVYPTIDMLEGRAVVWWFFLEDLLNQREKLSFSYAGRNYRFGIDAESKGAVFQRLKHLIRESNGDPALIDALFTSQGIDPQRYASCGLTYADTRAMLDSGLATIGVHTVHHRMLSRLPDAEIDSELLDSRRILEEQLGIACRHVSYPYGDRRAVTDRVVDRAQTLGFSTGVTTVMGQIHRQKVNSRYFLTLPRIEVLDEDGAFPDIGLAAKVSNLVPTVVGLRSRMRR